MRVWVFQATPEQYHIAEALKGFNVGDKDSWTVSRGRKQMQPGDIAVFWQAGEEQGVYAVGELLTPAYTPDWAPDAGTGMDGESCDEPGGPHFSTYGEAIDGFHQATAEDPEAESEWESFQKEVGEEGSARAAEQEKLKGMSAKEQADYHAAKGDEHLQKAVRAEVSGNKQLAADHLAMAKEHNLSAKEASARAGIIEKSAGEKSVEDWKAYYAAYPNTAKASGYWIESGLEEALNPKAAQALKEIGHGKKGEEPTSEKEPAYIKAKWWVQFRYTHIFCTRPLTREAIQADPRLSDWSLVRGVQGSSLSAPPHRWMALQDLLNAHVLGVVNEDLPLAPPKPTELAKDLDTLREEAMEAGKLPSKGKSESKQARYTRRHKISVYVQARAEGRCECCHQPAPFQQADGTPFLVPHHIDLVSQGGADQIDAVGAICPNCHAEIHYGAKGGEKNDELRQYFARLEHGRDSPGDHVT